MKLLMVILICISSSMVFAGETTQSEITLSDETRSFDIPPLEEAIRDMADPQKVEKKKSPACPRVQLPEHFVIQQEAVNADGDASYYVKNHDKYNHGLTDFFTYSDAYFSTYTPPRKRKSWWLDWWATPKAYDVTHMMMTDVNDKKVLTAVQGKVKSGGLRIDIKDCKGKAVGSIKEIGGESIKDIEVYGIYDGKGALVGRIEKQQSAYVETPGFEVKDLKGNIIKKVTRSYFDINNRNLGRQNVS